MGNFNFNVPSLGNKYVDYRQPIIGDSYNWSWVRPLSQVQYLAIHHSAGPDSQTPNDIARYHVQSRGWGGVGYHFIIDQSGTVFYVGDLTTARANVANNNHLVIGICLIGSFINGKQPNTAQIRGAHELCSQLLFRTPELPGTDGWEDVVGHKRFGATACPGDTWDEYRAKIILGNSQPTPTPTPNPSSNRIHEISELYHVVLGREPDQAGLNHYVSGSLSIDQIRKAMTESQEHRHLISKGQNFKQAQKLAEESKELVNQVSQKLNEITSLNN